ncbi:protein pitchfork-like [Callorhinchus milii]|uniref:protein pitchfork-like n=1 Tax=Callorhinchus milii TaxID=7868 RepID=UPI001C3F75D3|nr:protein pitchfork-like [Callorhinchus milii]
MSSSATMSSYSTLAASHLTQKDSHPVVKKIKVESYPDVEVFPLYWAKNRLGNEYPPIRGTPNRGPGTYNNHLRNSIVQNMKEKPLSNYGYVLGARTQRRFTQPCKLPEQMDKRQGVQAGSGSFWLFPSKKKKESWKDLVTPGPGTYEHQLKCNRRITWPMKFSSPDWSLVSSPKRRTLRIELPSDKDFRKHRNKMAYFSLYFN